LKNTSSVSVSLSSRPATAEAMKLSPSARKSIVGGRRLRLGPEIESRRCSLCRFAPPDKQRPVLILTRESVIGHLATVTVAPIPSTVRDVPSEVILDVDDGMKNRCVVNLHNAVTISQERLSNRVTSLRSERMREVCAALRFALGCD